MKHLPYMGKMQAAIPVYAGSIRGTSVHSIADDILNEKRKNFDKNVGILYVSFKYRELGYVYHYLNYRQAMTLKKKLIKLLKKFEDLQ